MNLDQGVQEEIFNDISYLELWPPFCSAERNHLCNFGWGYQEEQLCELFFEFGSVNQQEMPFKYFLSGALAAPCSVERNHLCNYERGRHGEHSCEVIWNLNQWFRRICCLKIFLIWSSGGLFVQRSEMICAILVEAIKRNYSAKLFWIWVSSSGEDAV